MLVRNNLPTDHPYIDSKTELQWRKNRRAIIDKDTGGIKLYANGHRNLICTFYTIEETRPATPEELYEWNRPARERARARRRQLRNVDWAKIEG